MFKIIKMKRFWSLLLFFLIIFVSFMYFKFKQKKYSNLEFLDSEKIYYVGDSIENYKLINCHFSKLFLNSIEKETTQNKFRVEFIQEYNHQLYSFNYTLEVDAIIPVYFDIKPTGISERRCFLNVKEITDNSLSLKLYTEK